MNKKAHRKRLLNLLIPLLVFVLYGCTDLFVDNLNEPDMKDFNLETDGLYSFSGTAFRTLHNAMQEYDSPAPSMSTMADQATCSWGYAAVLDLSREPRRGFINSQSYAYYFLVQVFWERCYSSISTVNDVLQIINNEKNTGMDKNLLRAWCYFISGVAHGYLGLTFDQGDVVLQDIDSETLELVPWEDMIDVSLDLLDQAIAIAEAESFTVPEEWMGGEPYTSSEFSALANSYAARILAYSSRNKTDNEQIGWNRVLQYSERGIQKNLQPEMGDRYGFYDMYLVYAIYPGWGRIDHRIINLMDPDYPSRWPSDGVSWTTPDGQDPGPAQSKDARLESDFEYLEENIFPPDRGYYLFSHYRHKRYDSFLSNVWYGDIPHPSFLVWENELLKAEAMVRTGNVSGALAVLNHPEGARRKRGKLPVVTTTEPSELLWTIFYERDIELINTGMGIAYFDMRRRDQLQQGTILHFPVPAKELKLMNLEVYTIAGMPDGKNISTGGWTGLD
jgi:starch-binding outer membrane protein, SusD/RagB family